MAELDQDTTFSNVSWHNEHDNLDNPTSSSQASDTVTMDDPSNGIMSTHENESRHDHPLGGHSLGPEKLQCIVSSPIKEGDGTKDAFVSYLVTTRSTFPSFQKPVTIVRRRFTDFVFLYKTLSKDYIACAVPPIPDKQRMEYVRGDRFGPDFTARRAHSLERFLARIALHPVLRRSTVLHNFLESPEWNATMRSRSARASTSSEPGSGGVFDNFADTFINAFTKVHKPDKRFIEVKEKTDKLEEDLSHIEKVVARVVRRESDLETDFRDLAEQFQRLISLEPGVEPALRAFSNCVEDSSSGLKRLRDVTDQDYLGSLRDMQAYGQALRALLKAREQKQLDFEQLTEYLNKSTAERDALQAASGAGSGSGSGSYYGGGGGLTAGASGFIRSKIEDVRGVDHEQARRERARKLELRIEELTREVEEAKRMSEMFDDEVVREVADFERIKRVELKRQFGGLADAHIQFYGDSIDIWEGYIRNMEKEGGTLPA